MKNTKEMFTKNSEITLRLITFLYCEGVPKEPVNCMSKKCMDGQCLCMDTEQLGLLLFRMFDERKWYPADLNDSAFVYVLTNEEEDKVKCRQQDPSESEIRLIKCRKAETQDKKMKKAAPQKIRSLLKMLPIIKMTNVMNKFSERYSLVYICTFGDCVASFVERFMAMMIEYVIDQYITEQNIVPILKKTELFFELLLRVNTGGLYENCVKNLVEQIEGYYNSMTRTNEVFVSLWADYMWAFRDTIKESKENHQDTDDIVELLYSDDEVEFVRLCHLLKTILEIIGVDYTFKNGNLQAYMNEKGECSHDVYDKLEDILIREKDSDIVRKKYVFSMLKKMFDKYGDWADEDLIQFSQSISN